jgi:beta-phosphoglucomutase
LASSAGRKRVEANLRQLGLTAYFQAVISGDDVVKGKPNPALFLMAADALKVSPREALVCEDAVNGVQAAKAAGMRCLAIASCRERETMLKAAGADQVASDFTCVSLHDLRTLFAVGEQSHAAAAGRRQP